MIEVFFLYGLALVWIIFASIEDLRTTEISDWLNYSLVAFALAFRFFYSLFNLNNLNFFYQGLLGFGIFFVLGNLFYYTRMFAGGDSKLMMALGAVLSLNLSFVPNLQVFLVFLMLFFFSGAVYGILSSVVTSIKKFKLFRKGFVNRLNESKKVLLFYSSFGILVMLLSFRIEALFPLGILCFVFPYFYFFIQTIDKDCMIRKVNVKNLMLGDWLYKDVKVGSKTVKATWDGLNEKEIKLLRKKKFVLIRRGIAFAPVFLISFVLLFFVLRFDLVSFLINLFRI